MGKYIKYILIFIIGIILGIIVHGIIEIPAIILLTNNFKELFLRISWSTWILIHNIFTAIIEILGVIFAFWIYKKFEKK